MTRDEKMAEARRLRGEGWTRRQIAARLGYASPSSITRLLQPPAVQAEYDRRSNANRAAAKRIWEREHDRQRCPCGQLRGAGAQRRSAGGLCGDCRREVVAVERAMREERIAEMWAAGATLRQIAASLGTTYQSVGRSIVRMREHGWDVPRRRHWSPEGLERAQNARRAA